MPAARPALELLYHPDRARGPLRRAGARGENRWLPLSWDEAIARLAAELGKLRAAGEPQSLVLLDGEERGTTHGLWARFLRAFGSPNHVGHGATGTGAMARAMAAMTGSASLPGYDFENARLVLLVGTGALESSPQAMLLARAVARGARPRLVCAWPRLPLSAALVDEWLPLAPNGQAALLLALAHVLLRESLADESGLRGFEARDQGNAGPGLRERIMAGFAPAQVEARIGVPARRIERLARELAAIRPSVVAVDETMSDDSSAAAGLLLDALLGGLDTAGGLRRDGGWEPPDWGGSRSTRRPSGACARAPSTDAIPRGPRSRLRAFSPCRTPCWQASPIRPRLCCSPFPTRPTRSRAAGAGWMPWPRCRWWFRSRRCSMNRRVSPTWCCPITPSSRGGT